MSNVKSRAVTDLRDHIYEEVEQAGITSITRSGKFVGVLITPGSVDEKVATRLQEIVHRNPQHGIGLLITQALSN